MSTNIDFIECWMLGITFLISCVINIKFIISIWPEQNSNEGCWKFYNLGRKSSFAFQLIMVLMVLLGNTGVHSGCQGVL